jgi:site-specific recombinase XerD
MFEKLYFRQRAIRWHREGPLAREREGYLEALARQGVPLTTLRLRACYSLSVAKALAGIWAEDRPFTVSELEKLAEAYAQTQVAKGRTSKIDHPRACFLHESLEFLKFVGRPVPTPPPAGQRDLKQLEDFIRACCHERGLSPHTEKVRRRDLLRFLRYLEGRGIELVQLTADHVDEFIKHLGQRWGRVSLKMVASTLRVFLRHAENRGWVRRGLANALLAPRIYGQEGLPLGPTWEEVARVAGDLEDQTRKFLRDRAAILLLSVYAMRSEEVRKLKIEDVDWERKRLRIVRYKSRREEFRPLEDGVAKALRAYIGHGRPECSHPEVLITERAPYRPLSGGGLTNIVRRQFDRVVQPVRRVSCHALRHACARHLQSTGFSLKEIGDHLSHSLPHTTQIYAKVDVDSLREVAMVDLEDLV